MKNLVKACLLAAIGCMPVHLLAQKDSIRLICPLNDAVVVPPPKNQVKFDEPDLCIVLMSIPDTVVKSVGTGRITNTENTEETGYGVVLFSKINGKEYYFWYTGMTKLLVRRNDVVKVGQPIGYISPGSKMELTMYEFETPIDPTGYLDCKGILKHD
jgi:Peptidase family M23